MGLRVIVGGSGGIGAAMVELIRERYPEDQIWSTSTQDSEAAFKLDYEVIDSIDELVEQIRSNDQPLSQLLVTTGLLHRNTLQPEKTFRNYSFDDSTRVMQVNALGPMLLLSRLFSALKRDTEVQVGVLSARVGSIEDNRLGGWYSYRASKSALNMLLKTLAIELSRTHPKAQILALHPGTTDTELSKPFQARVPEGKLFSPRYAAQCLLDQLENKAGGTSGQFIAWDGEAIPW